VNGMGHKELAQILKELTQALIANPSLGSRERKEAVENLHTLAGEASAPQEQRKIGTVKAALGYLPGLLSASTDVLNYFQVHLVDIQRFFGI